MPDRPLFSNESSLAGAAVIGLSIADPDAVPPVVGKLRLFNDSFVPDVGTTRDELIAAETTLTGYPVGGYDITAFSDPLYAPLGGAVITSNLISILYASGPAVVIGGYWVEDAATPTPRVREIYIYDPVRGLAVVGDGWPVVVQLGYGANV